MRIKRKFVALLACVMLCFASVMTVGAAESVNEFTPLSDDEVLTFQATDEGIVPLVPFAITMRDLEPGYYINADTTFYVTGDKDVLNFSVNWTPIGNDIYVLLINVQTGKQYAVTVSTGSAIGKMTTKGVPTGEYYVAIGNPNSNSTSINGSATCEWN